MPKSREHEPARIKEHLSQRGKEQITNVDNSRTDEKMVTTKPEAEKTEAPKKKKNIIRVYHAQNASDGGKNRPKRPASDKKPAARPQQKPQAVKPAEPVQQKPAAEAAPKKPQAAAPSETPETKKPTEIRQAAPVQNNSARPQRQEQSGYNNNRGQNRQNNRDGRDSGRDNRGGDNRGNRDFRGGEKRFSDRNGNNGQGRPNRDGNRPARPQGEGRPARQGDGNGRPMRGQGGRPQQGGQGRPGQGGNGRPDNRGEGRFGGNNRGGQRNGGGRRENDAVFTPELTKTSKDSKRERDRENKNKKKDFEKSGAGHNRPNQGGRRNLSRIPKALQKPTPQPKQEEKKPEVKEITLPEKMTIRELAEAMKMQPSVIVKKLFLEGTMVTVNHEIDFEKAQEIALDYDIIAEPEEKVDVIEELLKEDEEDEADMVSRPPVVCVMGHVDHGKTSLLDAIRDTHVTRGEAGGITQHIGASVVEINGQKITFLDTPGHEAFTAMRMRGANSTDIAVLVVAADDGVMPQTVEAINHAKAAKVPIIVAINKMDRPGANPDHVKQQLAEHELIPEDWGGDTIMVPVSAHQKTGISELLEMILLVAEMQDLKANPSLPAHGTIIEAQLDKGRGPVATVLVQRGTLQIGDTIIAGTAYGKVRAMVNDRGEKVKKALPSTPVEVLGLNDVPLAGDILDSTDEKIARSVAEKRVAKKRIEEIQQNSKVSLDDLFQRIQEGEIKDLNIVVKADVQGTIEALRSSLQNIKNDEVKVVVVHAGVGAITESDVMLASAANALIIGFNVRPDANARKAAEVEKVDVRTYRVIYDALNDVEAAIKGMLAPKFQETIQGRVEVRQLITISKMLIAGCYVLEGKITNTSKVRVVRDGIVINEDEIDTLRRFKDDVKEVAAGYECGVTLEKFRDLKEGDVFEVFTMEEVAVE